MKAYGQERYEIEKYERHLVADKKVKKLYTFLYGLSVGFAEIIFYVGILWNFVIGCAFVTGKIHNGNFDRDYRFGDCMGVFVWVLNGTYWFGNSFLNIEALQRGLNALQSVMEVIDHVPTINVEDDTLAPINSIDNIEYKNVVFQYKSRNNPAIRGVNINILKGKTTAFVGESGSGKTTIVKLLNRLYDPTEGEILINKQDLRSINLRQYRRRISYVSQEPSLFNESIKENLLNGNPSASDVEIEEALKVWMAYDFIQRLPQGIDTNFGEIGGILSGGQKQRIALARAVLRKPDLLILDEATSALDVSNETKVQKAVENVSKQFRMTTVVIAHRLNTVINADIIYVLNKGEVVEKGNHNELINNGQMYAEYYKSQQSAIKTFQAAERNYKDADKNESKDEDVGEGKGKDFKFKHNNEINFEEEVSAIQTSAKLLRFTNPKIYSKPYYLLTEYFFISNLYSKYFKTRIPVFSNGSMNSVSKFYRRFDSS